jgi:hypothetical protein
MDGFLLGVVVGVLGTLVCGFVVFSYMIRPPR